MTLTPSCMPLKLVRYNNSCTKHDSSSFSETGVDKQSGRQLDMCRIYMSLRHSTASENTGEREMGRCFLLIFMVCLQSCMGFYAEARENNHARRWDVYGEL